MARANALHRACASTEIVSEDISAYVTISIGVALSQNADDLSQIMRTADQALCAAKHRGRDRVARADTSESIAA
jgi:diguanylate cyclase (GGDEF)-like protein